MYDLEIGLFVQNTATPARMELVEGFDSKVIFMNCDAYTAENVDNFIKKLETSLGSYCDDYQTNKLIAHALKSTIWFSADLHVDFHFLKAIYCIHYPGFLHVYQAAGEQRKFADNCFQRIMSMRSYVASFVEDAPDCFPSEEHLPEVQDYHENYLSWTN